MIVVTGAAGFIGSCLARRLAAENQNLLFVDLTPSPAKAANLADLGDRPLMGHREFRDELLAGRLDPEVIFHLGACSSTTEMNWDYLLDVNVGYTQSLWQWSASRGRPFYYASSAATYGDGSAGFDDRTPPEALTPLNPYGRSKNEFDRWALEEVKAGRPAPPYWGGFKFFNVYGPREAHKGKMASVVWQSHRQIIETGEMKLFKSTDPKFPDGGQKRDFVFVEDCVDHLLWAWRAKPSSGIYNSGTGEARTFRDLVLAVFAALGREPQIRFIDMPAELAKQYQNYTQAVMTKIRAAGFAAAPTPLEEGVRRTVESYVANRVSA